MTGARATVEELSVGHGHQREDHERVRCLDLRVPEPENGGIWDDIDKGDIPSDLTDRMKVATARHYGSALPVWLNHIVGNEKVVEDARALIDFYLDEVGLDVADNIGHRVGKKFGIVYAAAILAEEAGILPWDRDDILAAVRDLHENALTTLYSEADQVRRGLAKLLTDAREGTWLRRGVGKTPKFSTRRSAKAFVRGENTLLIDLQEFDRAFSTVAIAEVARKRLADAGAIQAPAKGAMTKQVRVLIKGQEVKRRYLVIDLERLDVLETSLKAVPR